MEPLQKMSTNELSPRFVLGVCVPTVQRISGKINFVGAGCVCKGRYINNFFDPVHRAHISKPH